MSRSLWSAFAALVVKPTPAPAVPRFVCISHYPVEITYTCDAPHPLSHMIGSLAHPEGWTPTTHEHVWAQSHYSDRFTRDDVIDADVLKSFRSCKVGHELRRFHDERQVRIYNREDRIMVNWNEPESEGFLVGIAHSLDDAMRFVATGDRSRLFKPWEGKR